MDSIRIDLEAQDSREDSASVWALSAGDASGSGGKATTLEEILEGGFVGDARS
jgi:hypothetical protein